MHLKQLISLLVHEVAGVVIVDNSEGTNCPIRETDFGESSAVHILALRRNVGVASALNLGIGHALKMDARAVFLFDQDSLPLTGMAQKMIDCLSDLRSNGAPVAAIGPSLRDEKLTERPGKTERNDPIEVGHLITSGSLIPIDVFHHVGNFNDELFIDYVDIEWCLRARNKYQLKCFRAKVEMGHRFGDQPIKILGKSMAMRSPLRHYYMARNLVWLMGQNWLSLRDKLALGPIGFLRLAFYAIVGRPLLGHLHMIGAGISDGLRGRLGKREDKVAAL